MIRRLAAILALGFTISAQAAPIAAQARGCAMSHSSSARSCARCDLGPGPARSAALSASSCCHFETSEPATRALGIVPAPARESADGGSLLILSPDAPVRDAAHPPHPVFASALLRSTDSPPSLHTTLRL